MVSLFGGGIKRQRNSRKPAPISAHAAFVPALTIWGALLGGLAIMVLPPQSISHAGMILGGLVPDEFAQLSLAIIAALIGGLACFGIARSVSNRDSIYSPTVIAVTAQDVRPIDPSAELGAESFDAPVDESQFTSENEGHNQVFETHEQIDLDGSDDAIDAEPLAELYGEDEQPADEEAIEWVGFADSKGVEAFFAEEAPEETPATQVRKKLSETPTKVTIPRQLPPDAWAELSAAMRSDASPDSQLPADEWDAEDDQAAHQDTEDNSESKRPFDDSPVHPKWVSDEPITLHEEAQDSDYTSDFSQINSEGLAGTQSDLSRTESGQVSPKRPSAAPDIISGTAIQGLRETPTENLSLMQMVERFAAALHEHQALSDQEDGPPRDEALVDALRALAMFTERHEETAAIQNLDHDDESAQAERTKAELRNALSKLQQLSGAA